MKILITGASGFIGGKLWQAARRAGHTVIATGRRIMPDSDYHACDLSAGLKIDFVPDVVVHAAARSSPWGTRSEFTAQNIASTAEILRFCESHGKPYLLHISTSAVMYANEHQYGLTEESPLPEQAINRYAETKRLSEILVQSYSGRHCILRPRAVFGPGDTVVFPRILRAAKDGRLPLIEADQPVIGDLIYIDTLVDYLLRAIEIRPEGLYLVTNNQPVPILEFLGTVLTRLNLPVPTRRVAVSRAMRFAGLVECAYRLAPFLGEPPVTRFGVSVFAYSKTFDVRKAIRDLGPPSVGVDEGIDRFIRWQIQQSNS